MKKITNYWYALAFVSALIGSSNDLIAQVYPIEEVCVMNLGDGRLLFRQAKTDSLLQGQHRIIDGYRSEYLEATFKDGLYDGKYEEFKNKRKVSEGYYKAGVKDSLFRYYGYDFDKKKEIIIREVPLKDGKMNGIVKTYFNDGTIESEKGYRNGVEHGKDRLYDSKTGDCIRDFNFVDGKPEGIQKNRIIHSSRGEVSQYWEQSFYANGLREGDFTQIFTDGSARTLGKYKGGKKTGQWLVFNENGDTLSLNTYENGMLNGESISYSKGVREKIYHYRNDKKDGLCTDMNLSLGIPRKQAMYKEGRQHGEEKQFVVSARESETLYLLATTTYVNGRKDGPYTEEYLSVFTEKGEKKFKSKANGLKEKGQYKNDRRVGHWVKYDLKGKVEREWDE